ncbi:hypothetical protein WJX73_010343 [Symbiochloris irregularis]|uniref:MAU2 chromatid cohesion factor homolog n=1 Tax=Symbiochloris irregularis TaxID=706552 RepID=A0AAW1PFM6_9CHLO
MASEVLQELAQGFLDKGLVLQGMKCLEALCSSSLQLPASAARTRLQLAQLILQHTAQTSMARHHLERAQLSLQGCPGNLALKCQVASQLAHCLGKLGQVKLQRQTLLKALQLCREQQQLNSVEIAQQWELHFSCRLAALQFQLGDSEAAAAALQLASRLALSQPPLVQVLVNLFSAQLQIATGQQASADETLNRALKLLAASRTLPIASEAAALHMKHLEVHAHVLQLLSALAAGKSASLQTSALQLVQSLLAGLPPAEWSYEWLPRAVVTALLHLIAATILGPMAKQEAAGGHLTQGRRCLDAQMQATAIDLQAGEQAVAVQEAAAALVPSIHLSAGQYAAAMGQDKGIPEAAGQATEILKHYHLFDSPDLGALPQHERAAAMLVVAMTQVQVGDAGASQHFAKALKLAHTTLQNHHLVTQVLTQFAPTTMAAKDSAGASKMLASGVTLAKSLQDLPTQVQALQETARQLSLTGDTTKTQEYLASGERKEQELQQHLLAAADCPEHQMVLQWQPT